MLTRQPVILLVALLEVMTTPLCYIDSFGKIGVKK